MTFAKTSTLPRTRSRRSGIALTLIALILTPALTGCASWIRGAGGSPIVITRCPPLSAPPAGAIDALQAKVDTDAAVAAWVVDLDRHYQKLETCK